MLIFEIFTQNIDSKFDSTKALINKTGRALRARQFGFCRAFVESNVESIFCVNIAKIININARVTAVRVTAVRGDPVLGVIGAPLLALLRAPYCELFSDFFNFLVEFASIPARPADLEALLAKKGTDKANISTARFFRFPAAGNRQGEHVRYGFGVPIPVQNKQRYLS